MRVPGKWYQPAERSQSFTLVLATVLLRRRLGSDSGVTVLRSCGQLAWQIFGGDSGGAKGEGGGEGGGGNGAVSGGNGGGEGGEGATSAWLLAVQKTWRCPFSRSQDKYSLLKFLLSFPPSSPSFCSPIALVGFPLSLTWYR